MRNKKGFTLIEMLVVIAIIAVLISVIIPTVSASAVKAEAAADAANLRSVLGALNAELAVGAKKIDEAVLSIEAPKSKYVEDCELHVLYTNPGFIKVYYVNGTNYYGLDYLSDVATNGTTTMSTSKPIAGVNDTWYEIGIES